MIEVEAYMPVSPFQSEDISLLSVSPSKREHLKVDVKEFTIWWTSIDELKDFDAEELKDMGLSKAEREKVWKYYQMNDKKRSLLSILLQKALIHYTFLNTLTSYQIAKTREFKPFLSADPKLIGTWNYNVSHHGKFVCIASSSQFLVGADIVDLKHRSRMTKTALDFVHVFDGQLTEIEVETILSVKHEDNRYKMFFIHWALKESYIKAIGLGLGYDLKKIEFHIKFEGGNSAVRSLNRAVIEGSATAVIEGIKRSDWRFDFKSLDENHIMAIARGPLSDATNSYLSTAFKNFTEKELNTAVPVSLYQEALNKPLPKHSFKTFQDLLKVVKRKNEKRN